MIFTLGAPGPQGIPGPQGPQGEKGDPGEGVPTGGSSGQVLAKVDGVDYNTEWITVNPETSWGEITGTLSNQTDLQDALDDKQSVSGMSAYLPKSGNLSGLTDVGTAQENIGLGSGNEVTFLAVNTINGDLQNYLDGNGLQVSNLSTGNLIWVKSNGIQFPDSTVQTTAFPGSSGFAPIYSPAFTGNPTAPTPATSDNDTSIATTAFVKAQGLVPAGGTTGQLLAKSSGSNYATTWTTVIPGDRYLTTSTTSNTVSNGTKTFTVGTGLSYTTQQDVTIAADPGNHMHAVVTTYNSVSGVMVVDVKTHTGSGTYVSWTVNVGGTVPLASVAWGGVTGTLSNQTDLQGALDSKQSVSGMSAYLTKAGNLSGLANVTTARANLNLGPTVAQVFAGVSGSSGTPFSEDASYQTYNSSFTGFNSNYSFYTAVGPGEGGPYLTAFHQVEISRDSQSLSFSNNTYQTNGDLIASYELLLDSEGLASTRSVGSSWGIGIGGVTFPDATVQTTAGIGDAPSDGSQYARQDGAWSVVTGGGGGNYLPLSGGTMTGSIVFDGTSGQYISKGNFDTSRGGNYGISLVCSIGYEFNWQAGWLTTTNQGSVTPRPLYLDSLAGTTLRAWDSATDTGTEVGHTGITFPDATAQTTAGIEEAPMDNQPYVRFNGVWIVPPYSYVGSIVMIGTDIVNTASWGGAQFYLGRNGNVIANSDEFGNELYIGGSSGYDKSSSTYPFLGQLTLCSNFGFDHSLATNTPSTAGWTSLRNVAMTYNSFVTAPNFGGADLLTLVLDQNLYMTTAPYFTNTSSLYQVSMFGCSVSSSELLSCLSQIYNLGGAANNGYFDCSGGNNEALDPSAIEITQLQDAGWTVVFNSL
jgi:hypothetical protein